MRLCGEFHGTEQAVQTPVILIFQPGCACVFVAGDGHDVFAVVQRFGDIEFVRGVAVFAVADEYAVDPHVDRGGHAVERDADGAAILTGRIKTLGDGERAAIQCHMVGFGNVRLLRILMAVPRVLNIHVLVVHISRVLQVGGHVDAAESGIVEILGCERLFLKIDVGGLHHFHAPFAVEALLQIARLADRGNVRKGHVIGMCRRAIHCEHRGVGEPRGGCGGDLICHDFLVSET